MIAAIKTFSISQLFLYLNIALAVGFGDTLYLMRTFTDDYTAIPTDFLHVGLIGLIGLGAILIFIGMILKVRAIKKSSSNFAINIVAFGFLEILLVGFITWQTFLYVPRNHQSEERETLAGLVRGMNMNRPATINDDLTLDWAFFKGRVLIFNYRVEAHASVNEPSNRQGFLGQACSIFDAYSRYNTVAAITYVVSSDTDRFRVLFKPTDCHSKPKAGSTSVTGDQETKPKPTLPPLLPRSVVP